MHHLTYFVQVATSGSLVAAVEVLGVTQPAVSVAISDLERILGVPLFRRRPTGMELTSFGETFLHHVIAARANIAAAVASIQEMKNTTSGEVRVGIVPMDAVPFVHEAVVALKRSRPGILVSMITGSNERLLPELKIGGLDFVVSREAGPAMMSNLTHEPLFDGRIAVVAWPSGKHANPAQVELAELGDLPWVMPLPNTIIRERLEEEFAKRKVEFPRNRVDGGIATILGSWTADESSEAIVVCPFSLVEEKIAAGQLVEIPVSMDKTLPPTGITCRREGKPSESAALLMAAFRRVSAERRSNPSRERAGV
jgi:DNA-binding transcriptional LysR family regulator